jgi:hypothetical protein
MQNEYPVIANYLIRKSDEYVLGHNLATESFRSKVLRICGQRKPIPMSMIFQSMEKIEKLGEGVFGEVYLGYFNGGQTQTSRVYKVVVIEGDELVNGEKQKKFEEILPEIIVSQYGLQYTYMVRQLSSSSFMKSFSSIISFHLYAIADKLASCTKNTTTVQRTVSSKCTMFELRSGITRKILSKRGLNGIS